MIPRIVIKCFYEPDISEHAVERYMIEEKKVMNVQTGFLQHTFIREIECHFQKASQVNGTLKVEL